MLIQKGAKPKYLQLVEHLRGQIDNGELRPGDRLPSYVDLRKSHGLRQPTIDRSYAILENDGYIERVARKGIFVASPDAVKNILANYNPQKNSVVVLAGEVGHYVNHHRKTGWIDYISQGAINEVRTGSLNVHSLNTDRLQNSDIEYFLHHPPVGAIIISDNDFSAPMLENAVRMQDAGIPVVLYGDGPELTRFDRVISDHEQGNYELTRWLIGRGYRRILRVRSTPINSFYWGQMRDRGYLRAMSEAGLPALEPCEHPPFPTTDDELIVFENAARITSNHLADYLLNDEPVEAIMAVTDGEIYVLAAACRLLGKEPNKDVFLVGYDDYWEDPLERQWESAAPLATVDKRNLELGASLVQLLHDRIEGRCDAAPQLRLLKPHLIIVD